VISTPLARALRDSGLVWKPRVGDAFRIDRFEVDAEVFHLSDMTVEAHEFSTGIVLGFNGTTEWALDSVSIEDALWLPNETQLRELLRTAFTGFVATDAGFSVTATIDGFSCSFEAPIAEDAYARALLALIDASVGDTALDEDIPLA
jgi:hypothetical protein